MISSINFITSSTFVAVAYFFTTFKIFIILIFIIVQNYCQLKNQTARRKKIKVETSAVWKIGSAV